MLEGIYFQFPKLSFILFFFLACEALCPLRLNPIYFPRTAFFGTDETKPPLWMWIAKWAMISFFVVALMSPVREIKEEKSGYDILLVIDPSTITTTIIDEVESFIRRRPADRFAIYVPTPSPVMIPMSADHDALEKILSHLSQGESGEKVTREIERFFATTSEGRGLAMILSSNPTEFVRSLPVGVEVSVIEPNRYWMEMSDRSHPPYVQMAERKYYEYFYIYPLFLGFLSMLIYLYGRNQKGLV